MAIKLISVKCPECGAVLNIEENRQQAYCSYCGAKVLIHNENEYVYRHVDEAGIKKSDNDRIVKLKELEYADKLREDYNKAKQQRTVIVLSLLIAGVLMIIIGLFGGSRSGNPDSAFFMIAMVGLMFLISPTFIITEPVKAFKPERYIHTDLILVPSVVINYEGKDYHDVRNIIINAGFTNVECIAMNDLSFGVFKKPGTVASITFNGNVIKYSNKKAPKDARVIISYHSLGR